MDIIFDVISAAEATECFLDSCHSRQTEFVGRSIKLSNFIYHLQRANFLLSIVYDNGDVF